MVSGVTDLYVVNTDKITEFCEIIEYNKKVISKHLEIKLTNNVNDDYTVVFDNNLAQSVIIKHNLNSKIDYVLRYNDSRIITCDCIIDENTLEIFIPEQILKNTDFNSENDIFDLIIYSIDDQVYPENSFKCITVNNIEYTGKDVIITHNFNTNNIDSIIRVTLNIDGTIIDNLKAIYNNLILNRKQIMYDLPDYQSLYDEELLNIYHKENYEINNLNYDLPLNNVYTYTKNKYVNSIDEITIYTSEYNQAFYLTFFNNTENIKWSELEYTDKYGNIKIYKTVNIKYDLPGIVNFNLRELTSNALFNGYIDYILYDADKNIKSIQLIFTSDKYDLSSTYVLNLYTIHIGSDTNVNIN